MALSEDDRLRLLEAFAADETLKATQRLRALEEIGLIEARRRMREGRVREAEVVADAPDPMADLHAAEIERRERTRRRQARAAAR